MSKINYWTLTSTFGGSLIGSFSTEIPSSGLEALRIAQSSIILEKLLYVYGHRNHLSLLPQRWDIKLCDTLLSKTTHLVSICNSSILQVQEEALDSSVPEDICIDVRDIKIDSPQALSLLKRISSLNHVSISSVDFLLKKNPSISFEPTWFIRLFQFCEGTEMELGKIWISAISGELLDLDLYSPSTKGNEDEKAPNSNGTSNSTRRKS
jgi:hypothetical protein